MENAKIQDGFPMNRLEGTRVSVVAVDLETRVEALWKAQTRYKKFMKQKKI